MEFLKWGIRGGLSIGLLVLGGNGAIAGTLPNVPNLEVYTSPLKQETVAPDAGETVPPEAGEFETYTLPNAFSVQVPQGWFIEGKEAEGYALITSYGPDSEATQMGDVKTEVNLVNEPPQTYVDRQIDDLIQQGYVIDRFGLASVQGNEAFRIWIIDVPGDFTNQVITFVGFESGKTAKIISYYNEDSATMTETIMQIHRSFELVSEEE